jgi:hypothetical protein
MTVFVALRVLLIFSVSWTTKWVPTPAIAASDAILSVVGNFMGRPENLGTPVTAHLGATRSSGVPVPTQA